MIVIFPLHRLGRDFLLIKHWSMLKSQFKKIKTLKHIQTKHVYCQQGSEEACCAWRVVYVIFFYMKYAFIELILCTKRQATYKYHWASKRHRSIVNFYDDSISEIILDIFDVPFFMSLINFVYFIRGGCS